jgi:hypothetical protein
MVEEKEEVLLVVLDQLLRGANQLSVEKLENQNVIVTLLLFVHENLFKFK